MTDLISNWETQFGVRTLIEHAAKNPGPGNDRTLPAAGVAAAPTVEGRVNHSNWIIDCPFCDGAEFASFTRQTFFCCCCRNASVGFQPIPVSLPDDTTRQEIETELLTRPNAENRNWVSPETVVDLQAENTAMGVS